MKTAKSDEATKRSDAGLGRTRRGRWTLRRGAAAVEMAIVTPLLLTFLFGIIEFGWMFSVKNALVNAAREGARFGSLEDVDSSEIESRVIDALTPMGLQTHAAISITEPTEEDPTVTVTVTIPQSTISLVGNYFGTHDGNVVGSATMRREGIN